jgi:hypothetical protein
VIHSEIPENEAEAGMCVLRIDSSGSPPDTLLVFHFNDKEIQNGGRPETPIRCLLASGEQQSISISGTSFYKLESGLRHYDFEAKGRLGETLVGVPGSLRWVPVQGKQYTLKITISLTPPHVTGEGQNGSANAKFYSQGQGGTMRAQVIQDDDGHIVVQDEGTMYY